MGSPLMPMGPDGPMLTPEEAEEFNKAIASGARWVGKQAVAAGTWASDQAVAAGNWVAAQAKNAARSTLRGVADPGFDLAGSGVNAWRDFQRDIDNAVNSASKTMRDLINQLPWRSPQVPCVPCQQSAAQKAKAAAAVSADKAADGCLIGAGCQPTCKKGENVSRAEIAKVRANPVKPNSSNECCAKKRARWAAAGKPPRQITYVNGINTTKEAHCKTLHAIANQTCADVIGVYNATEGFVQDAIQTSQDRLLIKAANEGKAFQTHDGRNPAVDSLSDLVYGDAKAGESTEIWCHSQGGAVTSLALYDAKNEGRYSGIENSLANVNVTSYGSAAPYWPQGLQSATHYVNVNDVTPFAFGLGENPATDASRAPGSQVMRFSGPPIGPFTTDPLTRSWFPAATANHNIDTTYLDMAKQRSRELAAQGKGEADCG